MFVKSRRLSHADQGSLHADSQAQPLIWIELGELSSSPSIFPAGWWSSDMNSATLDQLTLAFNASLVQFDYNSLRIWKENNDLKFFLCNLPPRRKENSLQDTYEQGA